MCLEIARNPYALSSSLDSLVNEYKTDNRNLGEALILNSNLSSDSLNKLLEKCPQDLQILAIIHPNLSFEKQLEILSEIGDNELRTRARLLLLERKDIDIKIVVILCLDPVEKIRIRALERLRRIKNDTHSYNSL